MLLYKVCPYVKAFCTCTLVYNCQQTSAFVLLLSPEFWVIETRNRGWNVTVSIMIRESVGKAHELELAKVYVFNGARTQKSRASFVRSEHYNFRSGNLLPDISCTERRICLLHLEW
jgi:hypothetical protein